MTEAPKSPRHLRAVPSQVPTTESTAHDAGEDELLALACRGDRLAWSRLYELHFEAIYRHLGGMVCDAAVAEELAQEVFVRAFAKLDTFDGRAKLSTWLHGIGVNLAREHFRKESRRKRAYDRVRDASSDPAVRPRRGCPELSHERERRARALLSAVERLPPRLREAFVLMELRQLPREEVAQLLGASPGAVSIRVSRARRKIHVALRRSGLLDGPADGQEGGPA